jgi:bifunctional DNA-binding transcriptional regulator/antitoxin component of YhaV-PrlF toxin-antitoxin module
MKGKKGQTTIPTKVRDRYAMSPGTEVESGLRKDGALLRKKRGQRHQDAIGSLKDTWRWPNGIPHTVDAYIDHVRGGSYEELTARKPRPRRRESK